MYYVDCLQWKNSINVHTNKEFKIFNLLRTMNEKSFIHESHA